MRAQYPDTNNEFFRSIARSNLRAVLHQTWRPEDQFTPPDKSQDEIEEENRKKELLLEDNMVFLSEDQTAGDYDTNVYVRGDADFNGRQKPSDWNIPIDRSTEPLKQTQHYCVANIFQGKRFAVRGKGPEAGDNTSILDCTIGVALLLGMGGPQDRGTFPREESFVASLNRFHEMFYLELTGNNWNKSPLNRNKIVRDAMSVMFFDENPDLDRSMNIPFFSLWNSCTSFSPQLQFTTITVRMCGHCGTNLTRPITPEQKIRIRTHIALSARGGSVDQAVTMQQMLLREFRAYPSQERHQCGPSYGTVPQEIEERLMVLGELPTTLTIVPPANNFSIHASTADSISFDYLSDSGEKHVKYRWLGGVYYDNSESGHRVYWNDDDPSNPRGQLKIYDPALAYGPHGR
ncbi:hypothetical protein MMC26_005518 [Xylographa opegraphella]|nr:hypothetical protein [Xylographa opegraphella]